MNLDRDMSPNCLNILPLASSSLQYILYSRLCQIVYLILVSNFVNDEVEIMIFQALLLTKSCS